MSTFREPRMSDITAYCERRILECEQAAAAITEHQRWEERREHLRKVRGYRACMDMMAEVLQ